MISVALDRNTTNRYAQRCLTTSTNRPAFFSVSPMSKTSFPAFIPASIDSAARKAPR